ncbi:MAG: hypothetical protein ACK5ME_12620 [Parahaliea sp.]
MLSCRNVVVAMLALFIAGCSGVEVRPDDISTFEAGDYRYYKWRSEALQKRPTSTDPIYLIDPILRAAVDRELRDKGYILDAQRAQFSVDYVYAEGLRMGEPGAESSNISAYPGTVPNRNVDQASIDNAIALAGVKETSNIGLQFNDVGRREEVWRVIVTKIIENVNNTEMKALTITINSAIRHGLHDLPKAD